MINLKLVFLPIYFFLLVDKNISSNPYKIRVSEMIHFKGVLSAYLN